MYQDHPGALGSYMLAPTAFAQAPARVRAAAWVTIAAAWLTLALAGPGASSAVALPPPPDPNEPDTPRCLDELNLQRLTATPQTITLGQSTTVAWTVQVPSGCAAVHMTLNGQAVSKQGSRSFFPIANTSYSLKASYLNQTVAFPSIRVVVNLPDVVTIDGNHAQPLLRQALGRPNTTVRINNGVQLDMTQHTNISIADGVRLIGGRTPRDRGPWLYSTARARLFLIDRANNVQITGLRIHGPDAGIADDEGATSSAILMDSANNVDISNNEILGWKDSGIEVVDNHNRIHWASNPETVRIHDNFIHHNQRRHRNGYGVVIGNGAYALIDRNVFDWNRHAIAGDGSNGSGYRAHRNLVLSHGGYHREWHFFWQHTHQFDMHGQDSCNLDDRNCGTAGHDMDIRYNTFHYTEQEAIHLRGTPQAALEPPTKPYGAFVISNVFAHGNLGDAVKQNETGLYLALNRVGINTSNQLGSCDFDGDGTTDTFMATGQTWWFASPLTGHWTYLNTSQTLPPQLTLGHIDSDSRCDVAHGNLVSSGGTGPWLPRP